MKNVYAFDNYNLSLFSATLGVNCGMSTGRNGVVYAIDQQGGKGTANYAEDVMPTILSDSHGTPHAVAYAIESDKTEKAEETKSRAVGGVICLTNRGYECGDATETLRAESHGAIPMVAYAIDHVVLGGVIVQHKARVTTRRSVQP